MQQIRFPDGTSVPKLGQGTWRLGETPAGRADEIAAIRAGVELGLRVIDTAEMYGDGATERFLAEALAGLRDQVFLVSKAYPENAGRTRLPQACENSLRRLGTDRLDLYLLHWRGRVPLGETVDAMEKLVAAGKIRMWGVSNLDTDDMRALLDAGGERCATDQILYNLGRRGCEFDLLPFLRRHRIPAMAYSPVEQGRLADAPPLRQIAAARGLKPLQVALAWVLAQDDVLVIPKAGTAAHVRENADAAVLQLGAEEIALLDRSFPPPDRRRALEML